MKKFVLVALALLLALPAVSYAGSMTSRWDVTFGGYVKFDMAYSDQYQTADGYVVNRKGGTSDVANDKYGNTSMAAGETRMNFAIKGPDAAGAKTGAFIEGDFRGVSSGNNYGAFQLRHAFMTMTWPTAKLVIGQTWQPWGMPYSVNALGICDDSAFMKGLRQPEVYVTTKLSKEFSFTIGLASPANSLGGTAGANNDDRQRYDTSRDGFPHVMGEIAFGTDKCGKIGPNGLKMGVGGFLGQVKRIKNAAAANLDDDKKSTWATAFRAFIPIIPEKKMNKAGAFAISGNAFLGQGPRTGTSTYGYLAPGISMDFYQDNLQNIYAPGYAGFFALATYYFTNKFYANASYGYLKFNWSDAFKSDPANCNNLNGYNQLLVNLMYDLNPAIRFGVQWSNFNVTYAGAVNASAGVHINERVGTLNVYRFGAYYFF